MEPSNIFTLDDIKWGSTENYLQAEGFYVYGGRSN
jgi:hypothetical protein